MKELNTFGKEITGGFRERKRATGVVLNDKNEIALINLKSRHFHMLPGGGIDSNEDMEVALHRELREETGANVEIIKDLGIVVENLEERKMKQTTYFYLTKVAGEVQDPNYMPDELEQGFQVEWYQLDDAIKILENEREYELYIKRRELEGIREAQKFIV